MGNHQGILIFLVAYLFIAFIIQAKCILALEKDAARYRFLRSIDRRKCLEKTGEDAGVWIDCEDENGKLVLLTEDDADAAVDAAIAAASKGEEK